MKNCVCGGDRAYIDQKIDTHSFRNAHLITSHVCTNCGTLRFGSVKPIIENENN